ncbi:MAG: DMT family transporter [Selenomonadaceae bacterium]
MEQNKMLTGHLTAAFTVFVWGTTFISTKILLQALSPIEILFSRFILGFIALYLAYPHRLQIRDKQQQFVFAAAGLCGITLYYLLENIALTYSLASNVGVIISISPFFTALFAHWFLKGERLRLSFFIGFAAAITGITLITFSSSSVLHLDPFGDLLAIGAAIVWSFYSILTRKISAYGYPAVAATRHIFFYGLLFMLPALYIFDFHPDIAVFSNTVVLCNLLFLGLAASALCFVTWTIAVNILGAVRTSIYIYLVPVITVICSTLILSEQITPLAAIGILLTLSGLLISEGRLGSYIQALRSTHLS